MDTSASGATGISHIELVSGPEVYRIDLQRAEVKVNPKKNYIVLVCHYPSAQVAYVVFMDRKFLKKQFFVQEGPIYSRRSRVEADDLNQILREDDFHEVGQLTAYCAGDKATETAQKFMELFPTEWNDNINDIAVKRSGVKDLQAVAWLVIGSKGVQIRAGSKDSFLPYVYTLLDLKTAVKWDGVDVRSL